MAADVSRLPTTIAILLPELEQYSMRLLLSSRRTRRPLGNTLVRSTTFPRTGPAAALWAVDDPFLGKWKVSPAKSVLMDVMKVTSLGGNKYSFDFGGGSPETIVADGTDQPGSSGTTMSTTIISPNEWRGVRKKDGK
jgi:hypothetical protein